MKLYLRYFSIHLRCAMQYKASFFLTLVGQALVSVTALLSISFLFGRFYQVEGFTFYEVLLCYGVVTFAFSFSECFVRGFDTFGSVLSNGEFDRILVRPRNEIFQVLATKIEFSRLGRLITAIAVLAFALCSISLDWTAPRVLMLVLMIAGGVLLFSSLFLIYAALCFFSTEGLEFINIFTDGGREFGVYPMSIYGKELLRFYTYVVPMACVQYYPLLFLLGREDSPWFLLFPFASVAFFIPSLVLWRTGVRHYKSTGS